jgi:hypothetical protein
MTPESDSLSTMIVKRILTLSVLILFFGFTFNAYACLFPVYAVPSMGNGCSAAGEEPIRQFCDTFKTLGPQSISEPSHSSALQTAELLAPVQSTQVPDCLPGPPGRNLHCRINSPPPDVLSKTSVLRI